LQWDLLVPVFPICKNSYFKKDEKLKNIIPGGSSSGAAVSVVTNAVRFALASSTGGSIRLPASFNGVIGFKPTFGYVSRHGLIAFANSFDQIGFITKDVLNIKNFFSTISSKDPKDLHTLNKNQKIFSLKKKNNKINLLFLSKESAQIMCEKDIYNIYCKTISALEKTNKFNIEFINFSKDFFFKQ